MAYGLSAFDGFERTVGVESAESFAVGFGYDRNAVVGHHSIGLFAPEPPDRQESLHFGLLYKRVDEAVHSLRHHQGVEGMGRAVVVPEREGGVELSSRSLDHGVGGVAVGAVDVGYHVGLYKRVVIGGVEVGLLSVGAVHAVPPQIIVPVGAGLGAGGLEIPSW